MSDVKTKKNTKKNKSDRRVYVLLVPDEVADFLLFIMVHGMIPSAYAYNFWAERPGDEPTMVELTCLMPNGVVIPFEINRNVTLDQIKEVNISYVSKHLHILFVFILFMLLFILLCIYCQFNRIFGRRLLNILFMERLKMRHHMYFRVSTRMQR